MNDNMPTDSARSPQRNVLLVLFDQTKLIDVTGPLQVFSDARLPSGNPAYSVALVSEKGGEIRTDTCIPLPTTGFTTLPDRAWLTALVSGGDAAYGAAQSEALLGFLARIAPACRAAR